MTETRQLSIRLDASDPIKSFRYRWPSGNVETFGRGWNCVVLVDDRPVCVRHGIGSREVYGRIRVHSVTWINNWPSVEGVAADDYDHSHALLSLLKRPDKTMARTDDDIPDGYGGFTVVNHRDEIDAPYSKSGLAVKINDDNVAAWVTHAVIRAASLGRLSWPQTSHVPQPTAAATRSDQIPDPVPRSDPMRVVQALLEFADSLEAIPDRTPSFTPNPQGNELVLTNPFAFLLGVIFDQGIPAERAWQAPHELKKRLGHLDPGGIAEDPSGVATAVRGPPALHRFTTKLSGWIVSAANQVVARYGEDAAAIWNDTPTARELQNRFQAFDGIGQKKAAMAVELLERNLGIRIEAIHGSDVAYDVHVRRVFLRSGLAIKDDLDHIVSVARRLHPERPGRLDFVAWRIGRAWCHAGTPDCKPCVLHDVCPKEVFRAAGVRGA